MLDCILDQGLEDKVRDGDFHQLVGAFELDRQPVAKADRLDLQIGLQHVEFVAKRRLAAVVCGKSGACTEMKSDLTSSSSKLTFSTPSDFTTSGET